MGKNACKLRNGLMNLRRNNHRNRFIKVIISIKLVFLFRNLVLVVVVVVIAVFILI